MIFANCVTKIIATVITNLVTLKKGFPSTELWQKLNLNSSHSCYQFLRYDCCCRWDKINFKFGTNLVTLKRLSSTKMLQIGVAYFLAMIVAKLLQTWSHLKGFPSTKMWQKTQFSKIYRSDQIHDFRYMCDKNYSNSRYKFGHT